MAAEREVKFYPPVGKLPQDVAGDLPTAFLKVTAPIPEGWTVAMVAEHLKNVLSACAGGVSYRDVRNVFNKETITVTPNA